MVRDAHAEFRKGSWQKPATFAGLAAVLLVALFLLIPTEEEQPPQVNMTSEARGVIGSSMPPEVKQLEQETAKDHKEAFDRTEQSARQQAEGYPTARPADIPAEGEFARAFKESADTPDE